MVFLLLAAIGSLCAWLSHSHDQNNPLSSFLVTAFLTWRVSRGGRVSRMLSRAQQRSLESLRQRPSRGRAGLA
jgi:hypothetical protein